MVSRWVRISSWALVGVALVALALIIALRMTPAARQVPQANEVRQWVQAYLPVTAPVTRPALPSATDESESLGAATEANPPDPVDDEYWLEAGGRLDVPVTKGVLSNDRDVEGHSLQASIASGPEFGRLALNPDGSFTYIHTARDEEDRPVDGTDSFIYRLSNGGDHESMAVVNLTLTPVGEDPDHDGLTTEEETSYETDPNSADSDLDGLGDRDEIHTYNTDPLKPDTDEDGRMDGEEVQAGSDPLFGD